MGFFDPQPEVTSYSTTSPWGPQQQYMTDIYGQAQSGYQTKAAQGFMSDAERQALQAGYTLYGGMAQGGAQLAQGLGQAYQMAQDPYDFSIDYGNVEATMAQQQPYIDEMIQQGTTDIYTSMLEGPMQDAQAAAIASGSYGGSKAGVTEAVIASEAANQASRMATGLYSGGYQQALAIEQDRIMQDYQAQQAQQAQLAGYGSMGLQMGQQAVTGGMGLGAYEYGAQDRALAAYNQMIGAPVMTSESTGYTSTPSMFSKTLSTVGSGLMSYGIGKKAGLWGASPVKPAPVKPAPVNPVR